MPIIFLTGQQDQNLKETSSKGIQAEAKHYITKPFKLDDVLTKDQKARTLLMKLAGHHPPETGGMSAITSPAAMLVSGSAKASLTANRTLPSPPREHRPGALEVGRGHGEPFLRRLEAGNAPPPCRRRRAMPRSTGESPGCPSPRDDPGAATIAQAGGLWL